MIGRRAWIHESSRRALLACIGAGAGTLAATASGQSPPPTGSRRPGRYTVRRPAFPSPAGPGRTAPDLLQPDPALEQTLARLRERHSLPGLVAAIVRGDRVTSIASVGVRRMGSPAPLRITDPMHLGSCTKAMTATMIGALVEDGLLSWSSTIADVFPGLASRLHPDFLGVTLSDLLSHRAGLPHDAAWWRLPGQTPTDQRRAALLELMSVPPRSRPGAAYAYSNAGYVLAGLMAEQVTARSWQELMREILFEPLGMASAGFGPPGGRSSRASQVPWGHRANRGGLEPTRGDNPPCMGPAGTVHCTLPDWAKFAGLHLLAARGKARLLRIGTFQALHTPPPGCEYAGGWIVVDRPWAGGAAFTHSGSNTFWYSTIWIAPGREFATLVATNRGGDAAAEGCDMATRELIASVRFKPGRETPG